MDTERQRLTNRLHSILTSNEFTERDAFHLVGTLATTEPTVAGALAFHIRDLIQEQMDRATGEAEQIMRDNGAEEGDPFEIDVEINYSEVVADAYERTFFSPSHAALYGTEVFAGDLPKLTKLVEFLQTMVDIDEAAGDNVIPLHASALSTREH